MEKITKKISSIIEKNKKISQFIKDHKESVVLLLTLLSFSYYLYTDFSKQNKLQHHERLVLKEKSKPAQFILKYIDVDKLEQVQLSNIGSSMLVNLETEWEIYFISRQNDVYQITNIVNIVQSKSELLKKIISHGLIEHASDFEGLFGFKRKFSSAYLKPSIKKTENKIVNNKIFLDISPSVIQNALKLNKVMGTQMFVRWRIKYNEELSARERVAHKYIWFNEKANSDDEKRKDLETVVGGARVIKLIQEYEQNTKEIIFDGLR